MARHHGTNLTLNAPIEEVDLDTEVYLMRMLPDYIQEWLLFEAPASFSAGDILEEYRRRSAFSFESGDIWQSVFNDLKFQCRVDAQEQYGRDYPFGPSKVWVRRPLDSRPRRVVR